MVCSSVYTTRTIIPAPGWDWQFAGASSTDTMGGSGSNPNPAKARRSDSLSRSETETPGARRHILIVEDNESDVFLIRRALEATRLPLALSVAVDGEQAFRFFERVEADPDSPAPEVVILDINLPKKSGREVLKRLRASFRLAKVQVIVVSTSDLSSDRQDMNTLGADMYFHKPSEFAEFMKLGGLVKAVLYPAD